ncbi:MAG: RNA-directed DNA polymerase [Gammaproteobacteria bacterium]|nr:RNA-directed DNA polymerase [Gammaproteobacteria bacterium]
MALRFLVETVAGNNDSDWIYQTVPRKYLLSDTPSFYKFPKFKKNDENGEPVYREFVVPGPLSLLVESIVLGYFAQDEQFGKSKHIYSYIWPDSIYCPYNFEHYISGYKKRNEDIAEYLELNSGKVVIVSDIERFYPSINQEVARSRFGIKLENSNLPSEAKLLANRFLEDLFSFFPEGIGVITGTEFSHVVGDIALENFDSTLVTEYGDAYFRYVDDIVLIVDPEDKEEAVSLLESLASDEGLTINAEKNDVLTSDSWLRHGPHNEQSVRDGSFEALVFKIKTYLQVNLDSEKSLNQALNEAGFSIPISRLSRASKANGFVERLIDFVSNGWKVAIKAVASNEGAVVVEAKKVREGLHRQILQQTEANTPEGATLRKWHLQKLRYLVNRAVYTFPHSELSFLRDKLLKYPEFVDSVALLTALSDGDYKDLLNMPGAALNACAGILYQNERRLDDLIVEQNISAAQVESASVLALWDVINLDFSAVENLDRLTHDYLKVSSGVPLATRDINSFTYLDEISLLGTHKTKEDRLNTLESRFLDSEGWVLDALDIGWNSEY